MKPIPSCLDYFSAKVANYLEQISFSQEKFSSLVSKRKLTG